MNNLKIQKKNFPKCSFKVLITSNFLPITLSPKDPMLKLISNFSEINDIITLNNPEITKLLYFHIKNINDILYNEEKIIFLPSNIGTNFNLGYYFYLSLLITYNLTSVNFNYSIDYIFNLNNLKYDENKPFQEIIKAKITLDLIKNYEESDNSIYSENDNNKLSDINNNCINLIQEIIKNNESFAQLKLEFNESNSNIKSMEVDEIYIKILNGLIKNKKFEDY